VRPRRPCEELASQWLSCRAVHVCGVEEYWSGGTRSCRRLG
jgi:hypothetical protein